MQPARSTSLGVMLLLLASVGTASSECAWVLWSLNSIADESEWAAVKAYSSMGECETALDMYLAGKASTGERVIGDTWHRQFKGKKASATFRCFPDTIDPRGPKTK